MRSVVVTGATGFIGSALTARLLQGGARVTCLVRAASARASRLSGLPGATVVPFSSFDAAAVRPALEAARPEVIFHLASYGVDPAERDEQAMTEGNATLTKTLVAASAGLGLRRFVFTGTCSEYAPVAEPTRLTEDDAVVPASPYGAAKLVAAREGGALARELGVPFVALRLFGTFGPGEAAHRLVPYLAHHLSRGELPSLTGGAQARDLMFIDDAIDGLVAAAESPSITAGDAYNLCTGVAVRIADVAREVARTMSKPADDQALGLGRRPYRSDEAMWIVGDPTRLQRATGFRPRVTFSEGIRRAVAHEVGS